MKRFLVERVFSRALVVPVDEAGRRTCASVVAVNAACDVTWIRSYVSANPRHVWCLYEAPNEAALRLAAERNGLPVRRVVEVEEQDATEPAAWGDRSAR